MKLKMIGMSAVVASALAFAAGAKAQPPGEWMHGHGGGAGLEFLHGISLTDEQKTQIKGIEKSSWASMKPLMEKLRTAHEAQVNAFLGSGTVTAETLQPSVAQEESLRHEMDAIRLSTMLQIRGVLTPAQLAQAASTHAQIEQLHAQEHSLMTGASEE